MSKRPIKVEFLISQSNREYYWHIKASNGKIIAYSGETYKTRAKCFKAFYSLMNNVMIDNIKIVEKW